MSQPRCNYPPCAFPDKCESYMRCMSENNANPTNPTIDLLGLVEQFKMHIVYRKVHDDWIVWSGLRGAEGISRDIREAILMCAEKAKGED